MDEECRHGLGSPEWCTICKHGLGKVEEPEVVSTFAAKYEGRCTLCDERIEVGDVIHGLDTGTYIHQQCER